MRLQTFLHHGPQRIVITGASGLVGSNLSAFLSTGGHRVHHLVRRPPEPGSDEIEWVPEAGRIDTASIEGADVVVHLAGENISSGRWTTRHKETILKSRIDGTDLLARTLARLKRPPRVFISASAIGYYGNRGDEVLSEESEAGTGFLADVCREWEAAVEPASAAGIRVVNLRIGVVMSVSGGALAKMLVPFKFGLGGRLGKGSQYISWIALGDLIGGIYHLMFASDVSGAVNMVSPNPVTNSEFTSILGKVLNRPTVMPLPGPVVRLVFGEMGQSLLLDGARVQPSKLLDSGFQFLHPELGDALKTELGR